MQLFQSHLYGIESDDLLVVVLSDSKFQSHLYGIERAGLLEVLRRGDGFNRTFMELKALSTKAMAMSTVFQSHLFGIESGQRSDVMRRTCVSIAPLWN